MKNQASSWIFYTITMSRLIALIQPERAGEFSTSHVLIPDWIVSVAHRFTPIPTSFEAGGVLCAVSTNVSGENRHFAELDFN